jgi:hypothetical protein
MKIERISTEEIAAYIQNWPLRERPHIPLSTRRAQALSQHPFAGAEDPVLFVLWDGGEMVGFQTVMPDRGEAGEDFVWMSGGWVRPDRRREGLSGRLHGAVCQAYGHRLAWANLAPVRQKMLGARQDYLSMPELELVRYYRRFALSHFLAHRLPAAKVMKPVLKGVDKILNGLREPFLRWAAAADGPPPGVGGACTEEDSAFLRQFLPWSEIDTAYVNWALQYPWIGSTDQDRFEQEKYPFSCYADSFGRTWWRFRNAEGALEAMMWVQWRSGQVKVPLWVGTAAGGKRSASYFLEWLDRQKIDSITLSRAAGGFLSSANPSVLATRVISFPVYIHRDLAASGSSAFFDPFRLYRGDWGLT